MYVYVDVISKYNLHYCRRYSFSPSNTTPSLATTCCAAPSTMMFQPLLLALLATATSAAVDIRIDSRAGQRILENARALENNNGDNADYSFLSGYAIKFQGCHHVQQWNDQADEEDEVRIRTKRLARFRLCPSDQCSDDKSIGCNSKFGDYVVDMNTFVASYLEVMEEEQETICGNIYDDCNSSCSGEASCMQACYSDQGMSYCWQLQNAGDDDNDFDPLEYTECALFEGLGDNANRRRLEENQVDYYIGAYCADQGGEIQLGIFTDETCTTFAQYGDSMFYTAMGFYLPYSDTSLVSTRCLSCVNGDGDMSEQCGEIYQLSGKCETRMDIDYPNESSCSYIEGIKIIREDGVIRTSTTKKSKAAAVAIGFFMTLAVLLSGYVYYLRTKLSRAQINLQAASQPLT